MDYTSQFVEAIESSKVDVIIFSENANNSKQVMREVILAIEKGLDVIPFQVEVIDPSGSISNFLSTTNRIDGYPPPIEGHLDQLVKVLQIYIEKKTEVTAGEQANKMKADYQKGQGDRRGSIKYLINGTPDDHARVSTIAEVQNCDVTVEEARLKIINSITIQSVSSKGVIQFCIGDVTHAGSEHTVDVLVTSAFRDLFTSSTWISIQHSLT